MRVKLSDMVILCLKDKGKLTSKEIATEIGVHYKAVNKALGYLFKKGLVKRYKKAKETPYGVYEFPNVPAKWEAK